MAEQPATNLAARRACIFFPELAAVANSQLTKFAQYCSGRTGLHFPEQASLHAFSVADFRQFWRLFLDWSGIIAEGDTDPVCTHDNCEHAVFFPRLKLSYVENLLASRGPSDDGVPALTAVHGDGRPPERLKRGELRALVGHAAEALRQLGLQPGEHVVAIVGNDAEAVIACLATLALGATFSAVGPDLGASAILNRFAQLDPTLLIYGANAGLHVARSTSWLQDVVNGLPSLRHLVKLGQMEDLGGIAVKQWRLSELIAGTEAPLTSWPRFGFNHPLFILFSSGTTGTPKCIVHGAGGTLLEHVKEHRLHCDLRPGETLFFQTSCAWMMWNWQLSALASGAHVVLFDGFVSEAATLWDIVAKQQVNVFGTSASYLKLCQDAGFQPDDSLPAFRSVLSTGSILYDAQFDWVVENIKKVPVQSISGGTDIIGCFVLGSPNLPVWRGEVQCRSLGLDVQALAAPGEAYGELICRNPFPSRPLGFHGDPDGRRFHAAYFRQNPGVWTHGDFISFTPEGSARLHGRSDGVMNIRGIRVGPAELYAVLQGFPELREAMAVEQEMPSGDSRLVLLVVLQTSLSLDDALALRIRKAIGRDCSPVHVPAVVVQVAELPTTHSGKRSESAGRAAVNGQVARNREALANPDCLDAIAAHPLLRLPQLAARDLPPTTIEDELACIWEETFGFSPITPDDDFFELGGHSVVAMAIFARIRERFGRELPIVTLFTAPTVATLAALIKEAPENRFSSLVPVVAGQGRRLFLVHGLSGTVLELAHLLRLLRGGPPVSVLQARALDGSCAPHNSVEEMAAHYLSEIRTAQPSGPYALCGYSFGGLVAYEIATRLRQEGGEVVFLGLIDTALHSRCLSWWGTFNYAMRRLVLVKHELTSKPRESLMIEANRLANRIRLRLGREPHWRDPDLVMLPPALRRVRAGCERAFAAYKPPAYGGKVTFFRAEEQEPRRCDPLPMWRQRAEVEVITLPGNHFNLIRPPAAELLAEALYEKLSDSACLEPRPVLGRSSLTTAA